jgi:hypothetical protein
VTLLILIMESQSSKELEMPEKDMNSKQEQSYYNAQVKKDGSIPGATIPLTAAGPEHGNAGKKIVEAVHTAIDHEAA